MFVLLTVVLVILSLIISSSTSLKFFTNVVRHPGLKSESESNSPTSTESKLSCELRSSSYNARNSSCASLISFFSYNKNKNNSHFSNINNYLAFLICPISLVSYYNKSNQLFLLSKSVQLVQLLTDKQFVCLLFEILWHICVRPFESNEKKEIYFS